MDTYLVQQALAGRMFIGSTTSAGVVVPAHNATAQKFGLWNPANSGVNVILDKLTMSLATIGVEAVAGFGLSYLTNTLADVATGGQITAFTATTPVNGLLGGGTGTTKALSPRARFTLTATTSAPTHFYDLGLGLISSDLTDAGTSAFQRMVHDFAGAIIVPPGVYVGLGSSAASGQTIRASITWFEMEL